MQITFKHGQNNSSLGDIKSYADKHEKSQERSATPKRPLLDITNSYRNKSPIRQRLDEIEGEAQALKRSLLNDHQLTESELTTNSELRSTKKQLQKTSAMYQQLIKEHSVLVHEYKVKEWVGENMSRMLISTGFKRRPQSNGE